MTDYDKLVKALRWCMTKEDGITICEPCPYYGKGIDCENVLHTDAAAAIEELLEIVGMLDKHLSYWIDKAAEYYNQLPKRGEWVLKERAHYFKCSICKEPIPYKFGYGGNRYYNYCPRCGAKMEVQDGNK